MKTLLRKHLQDLSPYRSARDEFEGEAEVYLDANENPHDFSFNRYPDPYQKTLKQKLGLIKGINPQNLFFGNGSDEIIDLLVRTFCEPLKDAILTCVPGFSMYAFSAQLNQTVNDEFVLNEQFGLDCDSFLNQIKSNHKIIFLCSPNNPTGNSIPVETIQQICDAAPGLVVVDEAYVDFSETGTCVGKVNNDNLIVLQTFSKSYGSAGIRLGIGIMNSEIIDILNTTKLPYNVSEITQQYALSLLDDYSKIEESIQLIKQERERLKIALEKLSCVITVHPSDANFFLVKFVKAQLVYRYLMSKGVIVRDRSKVVLCECCLRITVGLPKENDRLIALLNDYKP